MTTTTSTEELNKGLESFGYKQELSRSLGLWDLIVYGMVFVMPIAPMGVFGYVASTSQGMPTLAYLICLVGIFFTVLSYRLMAKAVPIAGSVYAYASTAFGSKVGFLSGWMLLIDYMLIPCLCYVFASLALVSMIPVIPAWGWLIFFIVVNTFINFRGVVFSARFNRIILALQFLTLALFLFVGITALISGKVGHGFTMAPIYNASTFNINNIMAAASLAILSFLGFDAISTLTEETKGGGKTVGSAMIVVLILLGTLFMLQTYVASNIQPDWHELAKDPDNAFYRTAGLIGGSFLYSLTAGVTAFSWGITAAQASQSAVSRVLFSMGRDHLLPQVLSKVHPIHKTPYIALFFVAVVSLVVGLMYITDPEGITSLVNFGALTGFLMLHLSVIYYFLVKQKKTNYFIYGVLPILGFIVIAYVFFGLNEFTKKIGLAWFAIGVLVMLINTKRGIKTRLDV